MFALAEGAPSQSSGKRPWTEALLWLSFLGPLFFATYLGSLEIVSWREHVPVVVFDWELHIPFLAWTIVPYWSIDALYAIALFLPPSREDLRTLAFRLLTAQLIATAIFLIAPLRLTSVIPADTGAFAFFYGALGEVITKPFNMAPSLHIALLVILWMAYVKYLPRRWHWAVNIWAVLIGASVMTAFQHHFFDVPTGALLGLFCIWLWPDAAPSPVTQFSPSHDRHCIRLATLYGVGALLCFAVGTLVWGTGLWLWWPAVSLAFVSYAYAGGGAATFQKSTYGHQSLAVRLLLWPYRLGALINSRAWTQALESRIEIAANVWLGRIPSQPASGLSVIDLTAEFIRPAGAGMWRSVPALDLVTVPPHLLREAAREIEYARTKHPPVLVCCALGFSRSAAAVAAWLVATGRANNGADAVVMIRRARPQIRISAEQLAAIDALRVPEAVHA
ncbi:MAG: phosphatase PAP2/dual specificity phosphatase family protein [Hyphomicrobium sp.]|nr:phosphatase PAP2/dual specificity phosphatase family protein [Hyphomicrobium sp.]